jgi:heme-degrading monooxygenase HmoA
MSTQFNKNLHTKKWINPDDAYWIKLFWNDHEDVTRWTGWETFKHEQPLHAAAIQGAVKRVEMAKQSVSVLIDNLTGE